MPDYKFVDAIDASPTVLLDLDDQAPLNTVEGSKTPPPSKRYSSSGSTARDGDTVSQSSYNDRLLTIELAFRHGSTGEEQTEALQKLGRLLDSEQWLMWRHDGMIEPVFFRTRRGDLEVKDFIVNDKPVGRGVTLIIPAEPFAYGLPITGTATIANDPTAATNPMSYVFPDVQGDVATALSVRDHVNYLDTCMLSMSSSPLAPSAPIFRQTFASTAVTGWAVASAVVDTDAIGGTTNSLTKSSGTLARPVTVSFTDVPFGDWRIVMRARSTVDYSAGAQRRDLADAGKPALTSTSVAAKSSYRYVDLGPARLPANNAPSSPVGFDAATTNDVDVVVTFTTAATSGVIYPDTFMLVPAGLDDAAVSTMMLGGGVTPAFAVFPTQIDGLSDSLWVGDGSSYYSPATLAGALPKLLPGGRNVLTLVKSTKGRDDDKASPSVLDWMYYPRYLYVRPASS